MFFGDPVTALAHMRRAANTGARMAFVCWRPLDENPWMQVPMNAVARHLPPRPKPVPNAPGMFALADPRRISRFSPKPAGRRRGSTSSTSIWTSPPAAGWRRLWSVDPDRRRQQLAAQPAGGGPLSRHRVPPRGAGGASGRRERPPARCDVAGQQRARLSARCSRCDGS